jgi:hypothetical protein
MANVKFEYSGKLSDGRFWDETSNKRVVVELEDNDLSVPEMLEEFMNFMQAIGYKFEIGDRFDVVNDFKEFNKNDKQFDLDFGRGTSHTDFGAVPPKGQPIVDEGGTVIGFAPLPPDTAS